MRKRSAAADSAAAHADELFRSRLENQIDLRHPLAKLASRMPWSDLEDALAPTLPPDPNAVAVRRFRSDQRCNGKLLRADCFRRTAAGRCDAPAGSTISRA